MHTLPFGSFYGLTRLQASTSGFTFIEIADRGEQQIPRHTHLSAHFCFIVQGGYISTQDNSERLCSAGTMLYNPPGVIHNDRFRSPRGRCLTVSIEDQRFGELNAQASLPDHPSVMSQGEAAWLGARLYREIHNPDSLSFMALEGLTLELLAHTARRETRTSRVMPSWLKLAREIIHDKYSEHLTVGLLAAMVSVHPIHLARCFRQFFACSPAEYLRRRRVEYAAKRLICNKSPIVEIALETGFSDQSQFTKSFRRVTGMTPGQYRRAFRH